MHARLKSWSAWAPFLEDVEAWQRWSVDPWLPGSREKEAAKNAPSLSFVPAELRRRCGALSRAMLKVAYACLQPEERASTPTVFASCYGESQITFGLLQSLHAQELLSPQAFSQSVHNAAAGLYSIASHNRSPSTTLAAPPSRLLPAAFIEAIGMLQRSTNHAVLVVVGDEVLPALYHSATPEPQAQFALALLLCGDSATDQTSLTLKCQAVGGTPSMSPEPQALPFGLSFIRWLLSPENDLQQVEQETAWLFSKEGCEPPKVFSDGISGEN